MFFTKDFFKTISRFFGGKSVKAQNSLKNTEAYLDGFLKENEEKLKSIGEDHIRAKSELKNHLEKIETAKKTLASFENSVRIHNDKYKKTNDPTMLERAKEAFIYVKENRASLEELESQTVGYEAKVAKLAKAKAIFQNKITNARIQVNKKKSRMQYTKSMETMTTSIEDINITLDEASIESDEVNIAYHKASIKLEDLENEISVLNPDVETIDDEFERFIAGDKGEDNV